MRIFKVMNYLIKKQVSLVLLSLVLGVLTILSNIGLLGTSAVLISRAALHPDVLDLMVLIVLVRFFGISRGAFRYLERIISHNTTFKILSNIRKWFYKSFNENYSENKNFRAGDIYTRIVNNVDNLKEYYLRGIYPLIIAILTGILTAVFIAFFSKKLALIYVLVYVICGFVLPILLFMRNSKIIKMELQMKEEINKLLIDMLNGILEVRVYDMSDYFKTRFNSTTVKLSALQKKKNIINAVGENIHGLLAAILMAASLLVMAPIVSEGRLEGIYYAMLPLVIMASFEALMPMTNILYKFNEAYNAGKSIFPIIEQGTVYKKEKEEAAAGNYDLEVDRLSINKSLSSEYIIKDLSFKLPYGKKLAIVGASGSGKSTILRSILGFMNYQEGDIKLGDSSYRVLEKENIRKFFTYVDQSPFIFNTSLKENLLIANPEASEDEISQALKVSSIDGFVSSLPNRINTVLDQYGYNISGGEKQRIVISRALLKDAPIVLLDEPTASLDVTLENKVVQDLQNFLKDKSCIWVTHRLVAMEGMDEIIVLNKGRVVERGTHEELINMRGHYYKLWKLQVNI